MAKMSRHMVDVLITQKNWKPFIKSHWMNFSSKPRGGVIMSFIDHETFEFKCSHATANEILAHK